MIENLNQIAAAIREWREHHGFYTPKSIATEQERDMMLGKLMLIVTELTEVDEAENAPNWREEIADVAIRIMDITAACSIDLDGAIAAVSEVIVFTPNPMAIVNEISNAAEAVRHNDSTGLSKYLARAFWRINCIAQGVFDLRAEIEAKMKVNWQRPIKHGKLCSL